jgi:hypothetical protein
MLPALSGMLPDSFCCQTLDSARHKRSAGNMPAAAGRMPALPYTPRLKKNRYSSNRIMAPTTDMIQPAT